MSRDRPARVQGMGAPRARAWRLASAIGGAFALGAAVLAPGSAHAQMRGQRPSPAQAEREAAAELLARANSAARQGPRVEGFAAARQIYAYAPGALYGLYASPDYVSLILLEPGEAISAIAAGDTARWSVRQVEAESGRAARAVVLVRPEASGLRTNLVIVTDRRTYLIEAEALAGARYSAEIAWSYPEAPEAAREVHDGERNFGYRVRTVRGRTPRWTPEAVYDDGERTFIQFPEAAAHEDLPPLFVVTGEGRELVNYRVQGLVYVVDRIFNRAELRLGARTPVVVRIEATTARRLRAHRPGGGPP